MSTQSDVVGTEREAAVKRAQVAIRAAMSVAGRDDSTREERTKAAAKLVQHTEDLTWLAVLHPARWAADIAALATGTAFAEHARQVKAAVKAAAKPKQREVLNEQRKSATPQPAPARGTAPDGFLTRANPAVLVRLDRKIRMVDGVPTPGDPKPTLSNVVTILSEDPACRARVKYNAFTCMVEVDGLEKTDHLDTHVAVALNRAYDIDVPTDRVREALAYVAKQYGTYDPLTDYLDGVVWDGVKRIDTMLQDLFTVDVPVVLNEEGKEQSSPGLLASVARCMMVGLVARAYEPGCELHTMPVLVGLGGKGKSRGIKALCPNPAWFCDTQLDLRDKDRFQALDGVWIYENAEMDVLSAAALTRVKGFVSSAVDKYRRPYDRSPAWHRRRTGFIGSTNDREFGKDRRFHPLDVRDNAAVDVARIAELRDQLWGEAVAMYRAGVRWYLSEAQVGKMEQHADKYRVSSPYEPAVRRFIANREKAYEQADCGFHVSDVLSFIGIPSERWTDTRLVVTVAKILADEGCRKRRPRSMPWGARPTMWFRPDSLMASPDMTVHRPKPVVVAGADDDGGPPF